MSLIYTCEKNCCQIKTSVPNNVKFFHNRTNKKAGVFIYDPEEDRVLLVQSQGLLWGPPKGTLEEQLGENICECAIREVKEETGLTIDPNELTRIMKIKNRITYYYCERKATDVEIQKIEGNDANGITWIKVDCLIDYVKKKRMFLNKHCEITMKRFLNIVI